MAILRGGLIVESVTGQAVTIRGEIISIAGGGGGGGGGGGAPGGGGLGGSTDWQSKKKPGTAYVGYSGVGTSGIGSGNIDGFTWA